MSCRTAKSVDLFRGTMRRRRSARRLTETSSSIKKINPAVSANFLDKCWKRSEHAFAQFDHDLFAASKVPAAAAAHIYIYTPRAALFKTRSETCLSQEDSSNFIKVIFLCFIRATAEGGLNDSLLLQIGCFFDANFPVSWKYALVALA